MLDNFRPAKLYAIPVMIYKYFIASVFYELYDFHKNQISNYVDGREFNEILYYINMKLIDNRFPKDF